MIIFPWIPKAYWIALTFTGLPIVCYLWILPALLKNKQMNLLVILSLMLLFSQVFFILFVVFGSIVYNTNINDHSNISKMKVFNALEFIFLGLYYVLYCVAHWVFAMKYWVIACKMEII